MYPLLSPKIKKGEASMSKNRFLLVLYISVLLLGLTSPVLAETTATYDLSWWTVDSGGVTGLTSGSYTLSGTAGQPDADSVSAGDYDLAGGFWGALMVKINSFLPLIKK
jgi:hypothetical protein